MNFKEITELINLVDKSSINEVQVEQDSFKISIRRGAGAKTIYLDEQQKPSNVISQKDFSEEDEFKQDINKDAALYIIKSPIVGAFYASSNPETEPYVKTGTKVSKGDVLCIIEAMKLMNEINCDVNGEVVEVFAKNQELVEFGQPLFSIRTV